MSWVKATALVFVMLAVTAGGFFGFVAALMRLGGYLGWDELNFTAAVVFGGVALAWLLVMIWGVHGWLKD